MMQLGQVAANVIVLFGYSGPEYNCPGYESDPRVACTTIEEVVARVDPILLNVTDWCHEKCPRSTFSWDLPTPRFSVGIFLVIVVTITLIFRLKEDKVEALPRRDFLLQFWSQLKRKAAWQTILYGIISHTLFGVHNAAKPNANFAWLELSTFQQQVMQISEKMALFFGLQFVRRYALNFSWRKMVILGSCVVLVFNASYFLIIYNVWRNSWFYMATDVSTSFMYTLNIFVNLACMVEVAQPGYEAITYSLITTASNVVRPLSAVISYQLLAFFPLLNEQESIKTDTPQVRHQFAALQTLVIFLNISSLLTLPLIPRQKVETRELVARGEKSQFWGKFVILSLLSFLVYSSVVTFMTVIDYESYGCLKVLGGEGCTENESSLPALFLVSTILLYCYLTTFFIAFWPIAKGADEFSWKMFV
mmetsp:Transcript_14998/g.32331  ORF Transcript_14998/g.32331 Transcript_14998/m.32331 type:complete len:420 (+) Transcript_14998:796-2055(+)